MVLQGHNASGIVQGGAAVSTQNAALFTDLPRLRLRICVLWLIVRDGHRSGRRVFELHLGAPLLFLYFRVPRPCFVLCTSEIMSDREYNVLCELGDYAGSATT